MEQFCSRKLQKRDDAAEDFISKLPDQVLVSILSRLPLAEAARTSVLSVRWKNIWKKIVFSTLTLDISDIDTISELPEDRISQLSDDVLISLLSRLPLDEAARTRILSRRWKDLWPSMMNWSLALKSYGVD